MFVNSVSYRYVYFLRSSTIAYDTFDSFYRIVKLFFM